MEADVGRLDEDHRLAVAMGLHARLGAESPLSLLGKDALLGLRGQLGWVPSTCPHEAAEDVEAAGLCSSSQAASRREEVSPRIAVDITFDSTQIRKFLKEQGVPLTLLCASPYS